MSATAENVVPLHESPKKDRTVERTDFYEIVELAETGTLVVDCSKGDLSQGRWTRVAIIDIMEDLIGFHEIRRYGGVYPLHLLAPHVEAIEERWESNYGISRTHDYKPIVRLVERLKDFRKEAEAQIERRIESGVIEFEDVPFLFTRGREVVVATRDGLVGGVVERSEMKVTFFGNWVEVYVKVIHNLAGKPSEGTFTGYVDHYRGVQRIADLPVRLITEEEKRSLTERGRIFAKLSKPGSYASYRGSVVQPSWWSANHFKADGRVILDTPSLKRMDSDLFNNIQRRSGLAFEDDDPWCRREHAIAKGTLETVAEKDLWRCVPWLYGFSLAAKKWGQFNVAGLSDIRWADDAFDRLVLPPEEKAIVHALVKHHGGGFEDIIEGKGGGCIFLLHGPPGQGKTLTAEAVAEVLHRPLYSISVGELGTDPDSLEVRLRQILEIASVWNAVLLLDEADIFLEQRDEKDIVRNAMVGVFLRLLEYHQGVLFLTTNRVRQIDNAFYSRISVAIKFGEAERSKREAIWTNLLKAAGAEGIDVKMLGRHEINGRQIKNAIKIASTLARAEGVKLSLEHLERAIDRMVHFEKEMKLG